MKVSVSVSSVFECSVERAFKTPILCDVSKIHRGYGFMPRVTHTENDEDWGHPGSCKKVFVARSLTQNGGFASMDRVLERQENQYWKIQVDDFQSWMLGFYKFVGEWETVPLEEEKVRVNYTYTLYSNQAWLFPVNWLFAQLFWRRYMKRVLQIIKELAYNKEPYLYD